MDEKNVPWWRRALSFALGGIRSGFGLFSRTQNQKDAEPAVIEPAVPAVPVPAVPVPAVPVPTAPAPAVIEAPVIVVQQTEEPREEIDWSEFSAKADPVTEAAEEAEFVEEVEVEAVADEPAEVEPIHAGQVEVAAEEVPAEPVSEEIHGTPEVPVTAEDLESPVETVEVPPKAPEAVTESAVAEVAPTEAALEEIEEAPAAEIEVCEVPAPAEILAVPEAEVEILSAEVPESNESVPESFPEATRDSEQESGEQESEEQENELETEIGEVELTDGDLEKAPLESEAATETEAIEEVANTTLVEEALSVDDAVHEVNVSDVELPEELPVELDEPQAEETAEETGEPVAANEVDASDVADNEVEGDAVLAAECDAEPEAEPVTESGVETETIPPDSPEPADEAPDLNEPQQLIDAPELTVTTETDLNERMDVNETNPEQMSEPTVEPMPANEAAPEAEAAAAAPVAESAPIAETAEEEPAPAPAAQAPQKPFIKLESRDNEADLSPFSVVVSQVYDGPLDLLLDLIRKQDIDIYDIPIARITAQFLAYVNQLKATDVDVAGEFIYTASLLIHIKSKMLLPRAPTGPDEAAEDPRRELVERLLEHERFKNAAQMLQQKQMLEAATWSNPGIRDFKDDEAAEPEIAADTVDLVRVFRDILDRARNRPVINVQEDSVTVGQMIQFLSRRLTMEDKPIALRRLLSHTKSERSLIAMFLALLELVRLQAILLRQDKAFSEIFIKKHVGFEGVMNEGLANARDDWR